MRSIDSLSRTSYPVTMTHYKQRLVQLALAACAVGTILAAGALAETLPRKEAPVQPYRTDHKNAVRSGGDSPFRPGSEPAHIGDLSLFVGAGTEIERTEVEITPRAGAPALPIQVHCQPCDFSTIAPDAALALQIVPPGFAIPENRANRQYVSYRGYATLTIRLHGNPPAAGAAPLVRVRYYRAAELLGVTLFDLGVASTAP
jgi:hypothetical protein